MPRIFHGAYIYSIGATTMILPHIGQAFVNSERYCHSRFVALHIVTNVRRTHTHRCGMWRSAFPEEINRYSATVCRVPRISEQQYGDVAETFLTSRLIGAFPEQETFGLYCKCALRPDLCENSLIQRLQMCVPFVNCRVLLKPFRPITQLQ